MKLLIFSSPRTGSILLQWTLCIKHNLNSVQLHFRPKINELVELMKVQPFNKHQLLNDIKNEILNSQSFDNTVTKLEAGNITLFPYSYELIPFEYFNFETYDRIIFLDRKNIVDRLCSRIIANKIKKWHYNNDDLPLTKIDPISFDLQQHRRFLNMHLLDDICVKIIKNYCKVNSIASEDIFYEDLIPWVNENIKEKSFTLPTNYNYSEIFQNYSEIESYILSNKKTITVKFLEKNPQYQNLLEI